MIHLIYNLHLNQYALDHLDEFWKWVWEREPWFYDGMEMVHDTHWYVIESEAIVQHYVEFVDETAMRNYYDALSEKREDPEWEKRRNEQDQWYTIPGGSRIAQDPPVALGLNHFRTVRDTDPSNR